MREVAGGALLIGLPNGDVEAAVPDGVIGATEAARIASSARIAVTVTAPTP